MPNRADVLQEARKWLGTPFHHQARLMGHGVDCAQLVAAVGQALGLVPEYGDELRRYGRSPNPRRMGEVLSMYLDPVATPLHGDIFWMGWRRGLPMHVGFLTDLQGRGILHAYSASGCVVETVLSPAWEAQVVCWWSYRGLDG